MEICFCAPTTLLDSRNFCRIVLPPLNLFLLMDKELKTNPLFAFYLPLWSQDEQVRTLAFHLCSSDCDQDSLSFLFAHLQYKSGGAVFIPEQQTTPAQLWEYFLALAKGILSLDLPFFHPSQVGFLCYPTLEDALIRTKHLATLEKEQLFGEFFQSMFINSSSSSPLNEHP